MRSTEHESIQVPGWLRATLVIRQIGLLLWLEYRRPLRRAVEPKLRRNARNLGVAAVSAFALQVAERPLIIPLADLIDHRRWGLLKQFSMAGWLEVSLAVLMMDYTLYLWHVLVHRLPWGRMHVAHHVDLDMDASTALRFHFSELVVSVPWRAAQVTLIGVSPLALSVWQTFLMFSILFHHSIIQNETNSNWSSGLTVWDWLHGTLKLNVPQQEITIGVPAYREPEEVTYPKVMAMPFRKQRPTWQLPGNGEPVRSS